MALVAIDVGTTFIKCGRFNENNLAETWQYKTKDSAEIGGDLLRRVGQDNLAMSSVSPIATANIEKQIKRPIFKISAQSQEFIQGFQPTYGADRVADTVAARQLYAPKQNLAVIDMGTCTVLTTVAADGKVGGGFITLGLYGMIAGLKIASPLVPAVEELDYQQFDLDWGFNTREQIVNGAALAQIGIIERWLKLAREKLGQPLVSVATGGNATLLDNYSKTGLCPRLKEIVDYVDPHLTLKGIALIAAVQKS